MNTNDTTKKFCAYVKTIGAPPAKINEAIERAKSLCPALEFSAVGSYGDVALQIIYNADTPKTQFDGAYRQVVCILNNYIYALDDITIAERLVQLLKLRRLKISVAESFTGGGVSARLVEVAGVSEVYFEGLNTYSNLSKIQRLGVDEMTLKHHGAVSAQTAAQMAEGLLSGGNCDVGISTTGIAGPKSDNTNKPVGLAYIAVATADDTSVYEYNLKGTRKNITQTAINLALFAAFKKLK